MKKPLSRREAIRNIAITGSGTLLGQMAHGAGAKPIELAGKPLEIALSSVSSTTVRISIHPLENGVPQPISVDGALVRKDFGKTVARVPAVPRSNIKCGEFSVQIKTDPLIVRVSAKDHRVVQEFQIGQNAEVSFQLGEGALLGMGQGGPQFDRRGQVDQMGSGQAAFHLATHGAKVPIPFLISTAGWALYFHQPLGAFDLTGEKGLFRPAAARPALPLDIFLIAATAPAMLLSEYAKITGLPAMAPLWSFGYQQSHRTLGPPEEILQEAKIFREKKLPCDAMVYLGTDFCPNGWNTHNGDFDWNLKAFPEPKRVIDELHGENFKVVLHAVLEGERLTGSVADACSAAPLPSGRTPDQHWPPDRQVSCYWPVHKPLLDLGIDGWWPDQGDGLDGPSRLARNRMYFEGTQLQRPNERVYALHRNGYAGMQRYAAFLWSGDVQSRWETLKTHIAVGINTGLSGVPYWGTDIGGFVPTEEYTGELFARWFQFAAFNPLFRSHGRDWPLHLPWGWTNGEIGYPETPSYHPTSDVLHNPAIEPVCKKYLELRYQLMPYLYSAVKEACETGLPIIRALWLHYPDDKLAVARGDEYLYGRDILVAPVVEKGATERTLYLPRGKWFDFWTHEAAEGGREITRKVDLETLPLYIRAGAVIPLGPVKQYTAEAVDGPLTIWIHPGADGAFSLYEDDGKSFNFRQGEFTRLEMAWNDQRRQLSLRTGKDGKAMSTARKNISVRVAGESVTREAIFEGRPLVLKL